MNDASLWYALILAGVGVVVYSVEERASSGRVNSSCLADWESCARQIDLDLAVFRRFRHTMDIYGVGNNRRLALSEEGEGAETTTFATQTNSNPLKSVRDETRAEQRSGTDSVRSRSSGRGFPRELAVDLGEGVKMELVLVPAGDFVMGDEKGAFWEKPAHKVTITTPFYLGKYPVTQEQWEAVMANNPSHYKGRRKPVEMVSWLDCQEFLVTLNKKLGIGAARFSLPTEAQWEYACRAGTTTRYSFGNDATLLGEYAWWRQDMDVTHLVGLKKPNNWGLYDMHGNVFEWCADWWSEDYYRKSPAADPPGPPSGTHRVVRGGRWGLRSPEIFRCACRVNGDPNQRTSDQGFRVARGASSGVPRPGESGNLDSLGCAGRARFECPSQKLRPGDVSAERPHVDLGGEGENGHTEADDPSRIRLFLHYSRTGSAELAIRADAYHHAAREYR